MTRRAGINGFDYSQQLESERGGGKEALTCRKNDSRHTDYTVMRIRYSTFSCACCFGCVGGVM